METKCCTKCNILKPLDQFGNDNSKPDGKRPSCKECKSKSDKEYRDKHLEEKRAKDRQYAKDNAIKQREKAKKWYYDNTTRAKEAMKNWRMSNQEKVQEYKKAYNEKNKDKMRVYMNNYQKNRYVNDLNYHIKSLLNARLRSYVKKETQTLEYINCSIEQFKSWIEYQFDSNMSWENMGSYWHFDHVVPCASFDFSKQDEIYECYNWTNIRPLEKIENISKGSRIDQKVISKHQEIIESFMNLSLNQE